MTSSFTLLFVDDEEDIVNSLYRTFRKGYNVIRCLSGQEAIDIINKTPIDLIISDQRMPIVTGTDVLSHAFKTQPKAIRILLTGYSDMGSLVECVNEAQIYKYLSKPWEPEDLRLTVVRALESLQLDRQLEVANESLSDAYLNAITMLGMACEGKDETTANHVRRVRYYTEALALEVGIPDNEAVHMGIMSMLHDVGKIYIPDTILKKPESLTDDEWTEMKRHAEYGAKILGEHPYYSVAKDIAVGHHENYDGSGYPSGLIGDEIPLSARIAKVADTFDALTTVRPYKEAWTINTAIEWMNEKANTMFDPDLINALLKLEGNGKLKKIMSELHDN